MFGGHWIKCIYACVQWVLTRWGRVTNIYISKLNTIGSDSGFSPGGRRCIFCTKAGILLIRNKLPCNFNQSSYIFIQGMHFKMSSGKWRPFCTVLGVLISSYIYARDHTCTVYPKKYAHGFCFAVLCCGYTLTDFPISIRLTSLALWQSNDCPSASKATLMNMDKYFMWIHYERLHNHNKAKHNKTVCIFLGIYCTCVCMCRYRYISLESRIPIAHHTPVH